MLLYTQGCAHARTQREGGRNATSISQALDVFTAASVKNCHISHFAHSWADWDGGRVTKKAETRTKSKLCNWVSNSRHLNTDRAALEKLFRMLEHKGK